MKTRTHTLLKRLEKLRNAYGGDSAAQKLDLLGRLEHTRLANADEVRRLHEFLAFTQAYPDDKPVLNQVERMLAGFERRADLRRHRKELADTGIAGTDTYYRFFWPTALWLAKRHPDRLTIDWPEFEAKRKMAELLFVLMTYSESPALEALDYSPREWLERLKGRGETDATFLIRRYSALKATTFAREKFYEDLDIPLRLAPGPRTPTRTRAKLKGMPVVFQTRPLSKTRPDMRLESKRPPLSVRSLSPGEGQRLIDAALGAMVTRSRDLDAFDFADRNDVRLVNCGGGLQFACIGQTPERRLLLEAVYGFLTIKNGVPIGYVLSSSLFSSSEIAYNVFETYRGGESVQILGRVLGMVRHLFGSSTFSIDPYQLGYGNPEGLKSGAWWFYYKLGFRPEDRDVRRLLRRELKLMRKNPAHRSSQAVLEELSSQPLFLYLDRKKRSVLAKIPVGELGLKISRLLAERFGADRERGIRTLSREAERLLRVSSRQNWSPGEQLAWDRWSPLLLLLPGVSRWKSEDGRALVRIVRAKGGRRESDFVNLFNGNRHLQRALLRLAENATSH
ncbi:MAG: hypothetical protein JSW03_10745 [Candidatus Eiseniibacteriota bacterium]|nr:MAG: hypothetical protein JSW03_10745 [Candidatus Eisenbacteria bacterium]